MRQLIYSSHQTDGEGNPAGGEALAIGLKISWQNGPLGRGEGRQEPNGCFVETVILAAIHRLDHYQASKYSCRENAIAITKLQEALDQLDHRSAEREARAVEGTHKV